MPSNGYSVGRDGYLSVVLNGQVQPWQVRTKFSYEVENKIAESYQVDTGLTVPVPVAPKGSGTIHYDRMNSQFERYFSQFFANWQAGLNILSLTLKFRVTEPSGATTRYTFEQVAFGKLNAGVWELEDLVRMDCTFRFANYIVK